jgi:hypothetical protein
VDVTRFFLLLGIVILQISPEVTGNPRNPAERPHLMEEAEVDSLMPTTGARDPVLVEALEGAPAAVPEREAFLRGFRGAFQEREIPTERIAKKTGTVRPGAPLRNGLRLADEMNEKGAWSVRVRLEWFTPQDSTADSLARAWPGRSARVTITVGWPQGPRILPPELPRIEWLRFPTGHPVDAAYYQQAGWQVGFLVLEAVQRANGDLNDDQRLRLEDTRRITPITTR